MRLSFVRQSAVCLALAATAALAGSCSKQPQTNISIGTGGTGGVYYPYGGGLAELWSKHVPGVRAVAEVTGASIENVRLAHKGETVIGEIMGDVAQQAYRGRGQFEGSPQNILGLAVMYPSVLQIVTLQGSGVHGLSEFAGRTVSIGAPGSGTAFMSDLLLETLQISQNSFRVRRLSFVENANALKDRSIDVGIWVVAPPTSSLMELATTHGIRIIPLTPDEQNQVTQHYGCYSAYDLPAGTYHGVDEAVPTISVWNLIICKGDLPDQLVYNLTKALFEHNEYMQKIHPYARFTTPENTVEHSSIPLHMGTIEYLRERGLAVPENLLPKN
ncbi:MAG: TAXI family TRAP transporter solute-binding subunit [Planctomycetes bacterium]|nr:TAXI family TRAP transporter solute-binding subunit [Planctomycetota bacterium]